MTTFTVHCILLAVNEWKTSIQITRSFIKNNITCMYYSPWDILNINKSRHEQKKKKCLIGKLPAINIIICKIIDIKVFPPRFKCII